ncbi:hypothetical protein CAPN010_16770 [Capnocytophaga cynodegmi]|uniref:ParB N-terminal domain-containing protein n=1 Tax=Capnocytophaga cynodegmi TaxID=28189 RepID=UPI001EE23F1E|nr:ParB N-terminal domain-containing protein [Capnocytophaga cynodegmi]GJQ07519.1 hypothetical protein CAPN010_16770 [Capnocytophaga cynodegmi]
MTKPKKEKKEKQLYNKSETITIKRSQINFAPFNPKKHSQEQIAQMRKNIKNVGFLGGIIWNEQTSNLVDGHKRTMSLDLIHGYDGTPEKDYDIKVEKVSFDLKTEKEQNIFQTRSRTELDEELMRSLIPEIDYKNAVLDDYDLNLYAVDYSNFEVPNVSQEIEDVYQPIKQQKEIEREVKKELSDKEKKQAVKQSKEDIRQKAIEKAQNLDAYVTLSFDNWKNKEAFMLRMGFDPEFKMIKGETLSSMVERID